MSLYNYTLFCNFLCCVFFLPTVQISLPLDGRTWAIAESVDPEDPTPSTPFARPPIIVTQHAQPPRQLVLLTTHGSYLLTKLRPVDQLQHLLEVERGAGGEAVEAFFRLHKVQGSSGYLLARVCACIHSQIVLHPMQETQACAMSLMLATAPNQQVTLYHHTCIYLYMLFAYNIQRNISL